MAFTIEEVSIRTKVNSSTIRYYERRGVLPAPKQASSGSREYNAVDIERVNFVRFSRQLGIDLDEIRALIEMIGEGNAEEIDVAEQAMRFEALRLERFHSSLRNVSAAIRAGEIDEADAFALLALDGDGRTGGADVNENAATLLTSDGITVNPLQTPTSKRKRAKC